MATNMHRLVSWQALKTVGARYYRSTPRCKDSHHDDGHDSNSGGAGPKSNLASFVMWKDSPQLDKDVSNVKLKLDHLESGQKEMKAEIEELGNKMERKFDKTNSKIDRVLYGIIIGLVGYVLLDMS